MSTRIVPYQPEHIAAVRDLNRRLADGNAGFEFPEEPESATLPHQPGRSTYQEYFLALDDKRVHGGYILKTQGCAIGGNETTIGNYQLPLSEGIVNPHYALVGIQLLFDAMKRQPRLYSLGMGGITRPLPVMLRKTGWFVKLVPFYFLVRNPQRFLRNLSYLRHNAFTRALMESLYWSGLGFISLQSFNAISSATTRNRNRSDAVIMGDFGDWTDKIWKEARKHYQFIGTRDVVTLQVFYPSEDPRFTRLMILDKGNAVGWAVVMATHLSEHKQFRNMHLGTIVDSLALPGYESAVIKHATEYLKMRNVDLVVANYSHDRWTQALRASGFIRGPSNYGFACSPDLHREISGIEACHLTRGDGDGPIHL